MTPRPLARRVLRAAAWLGLAAGLVLVLPQRAAAQITVDVTVPAGVSFTVRDASVATAGSACTVTWDRPKRFASTQALRVSVKADAAAFSGPGTTHPSAATVSWTATASSGTASNGTLSSSAYVQLFVSPTNLKSNDTGTINVAWRLGSILAPGLRSGSHTLVVRWKFEAF